MTVKLSLKTDPLRVPLKAPYSSVTVKVRRLRSPEWDGAREAAQGIVNDDAKLWPILVEHDLLPAGGLKALKRKRDNDPIEYWAFLSGVVAWLVAVECALLGLLEWEGIIDQETGAPAEINRATLQVLLLDDAMSQQLMQLLTDAARVLVVEGKP